MRLVVARDSDELAALAADLFRLRVREQPGLAMAVPAGHTPRRTYARLAALQPSDPVDFRRMRVFSVDELCPPAPPDGYFWRQVRTEFLAWAAVPAARYMCGLGPNAHLASNEPGTPFESVTRPVTLLPATVRYILTGSVVQGEVCDRAVTLGLATIMAAREVVVLVGGAHKRGALAAALQGPVTPAVPASAPAPPRLRRAGRPRRRPLLTGRIGWRSADPSREEPDGPPGDRAQHPGRA